jgi:hypothetical protein
MRYLIGIAIGLAIIFNWTTIKSYFDEKIIEQSSPKSTVSDTSEKVVKPTEDSTKKPDGAKQDLFKEFK